MNARGDYLPSAKLALLEIRAKLLATVREHFAAHDYWEVETPILSQDVVVDAHLEPFAVPWREDGGPGTMYLQTSPEFGMKRLLAAGAKAIYQVTRAFRKGEQGPRHNPEFTMVEWYRAGDTHHDQMDFVEGLVSAVISASPRLRDVTPRLTRPFARLSYDEAFETAIGCKVLSLSTIELAQLARRLDIVVPESIDENDRDGWLNLLLAEKVEPTLGPEVPTFLYDYPASQSALARIRNDAIPVAERFELYMNGIELCNGYHELTDPAELRRRMAVQAAIRAGDGRPALPDQNRLLDAMEAGLPASSGVALGFDRLVMLAVGAQSIDEVIAFPFDRA
ncbi:MAG: EF-P lysine aminoacylase EpmA [Planctomycetaceae bacterium]